MDIVRQKSTIFSKISHNNEVNTTLLALSIFHREQNYLQQKSACMNCFKLAKKFSIDAQNSTSCQNRAQKFWNEPFFDVFEKAGLKTQKAFFFKNFFSERNASSINWRYGEKIICSTLGTLTILYLQEYFDISMKNINNLFVILKNDLNLKLFLSERNVTDLLIKFLKGIKFVNVVKWPRKSCVMNWPRKEDLSFLNWEVKWQALIQVAL